MIVRAFANCNFTKTTAALVQVDDNAYSSSSTPYHVSRLYLRLSGQYSQPYPTFSLARNNGWKLRQTFPGTLLDLLLWWRKAVEFMIRMIHSLEETPEDILSPTPRDSVTNRVSRAEMFGANLCTERSCNNVKKCCYIMPKDAHHRIDLTRHERFN